jgi:hypothetical protein
MKRHFFIVDELDAVAALERELTARGVASEKIHVLSLNDVDTERRQLHDVQSLMKRDVIHSTEIGALVGLAASIVAIAAAQVTGLAERVGWVPFVFLAIVLLGFFTWEGGLWGIQVPNSRFRRFENALRAGQHIFFVDVESRDEDTLRSVLKAHPELREAGTGSSSPRWLVGFQQNVRRFMRWAP